MGIEWKETSLGEFLDKEGGSLLTGPFGTALKAAEYTPTGVPVISVAEIGFGRIQIHSRTPRVSPKVTERLSKYLLQPGDIVFARKGAGTAVERSALVSRNEAGWFLGSDSIRLRLPESCSRRYVSYWLQSQRHRSWMKQHSVGTTMPALNQAILSRIPILFPSLPNQTAIAGILGTLDDKIDLNRRMNETLETMARALFKSWFIDFDPVRAKADGQKPEGMDEATAELFPDTFEESELGQIPDGWTAAKLPEVFEVNPYRSLLKGEIASYLDMQSMPTSGHHPSDWTNRPFGSGMKFQNGDTLVARITPCLENGKTAFVDFLADGFIGWGSTEYIVFRPKPPLPPQYAYYLARTEEFRAFAIQNMTGTSGRQRVPSTCFEGYTVLVPSEGVAKRFGAATSATMERIRTNAEESRTLASTRDALLPRLLSGELRIKDADRFVEAVL